MKQLEETLNRLADVPMTPPAAAGILNALNALEQGNPVEPFPIEGISALTPRELSILLGSFPQQAAEPQVASDDGEE